MWIGKIVRPKNPSDFEKVVGAVYVVVDVYEGVAELWPYYDMNAKKLVEQKLVATLSKEYSWPVWFRVSGIVFHEDDEVYVPIDELVENYDVLDDDEVVELWKKGIISANSFAYWKIKCGDVE